MRLNQSYGLILSQSYSLFRIILLALLLVKRVNPKIIYQKLGYHSEDQHSYQHYNHYQELGIN